MIWINIGNFYASVPILMTCTFVKDLQQSSLSRLILKLYSSYAIIYMIYRISSLHRITRNRSMLKRLMTIYCALLLCILRVNCWLQICNVFSVQCLFIVYINSRLTQVSCQLANYFSSSLAFFSQTFKNQKINKFKPDSLTISILRD